MSVQYLTNLIWNTHELWCVIQAIFAQGEKIAGVGSESTIPFSLKKESEKCKLVTQSCQTLCDLMDCSPPGSSIHGILQARILEWVAISFSSGSFQSRIKPRSPALQVDSLSTEPPGKPTLRSKKGGSSKCLENSIDGRVWWAAVYGVAQSRTGLKQLSSSSSSKWSNLTCHCFDFYKSATKEKNPYISVYVYSQNAFIYKRVTGSMASHPVLPLTDGAAWRQTTQVFSVSPSSVL